LALGVLLPLLLWVSLADGFTLSSQVGLCPSPCIVGTYDEDHKLWGRGEGCLPEACPPETPEEGGGGDVVGLPELHVGAGGGKGSELEAVLDALAVEGTSLVVLTDRTAVL